MSFGFSVGDFVNATNLITNIIGSLRASGGSSSDYQELIRELGLLQRALTDIEHLTGPLSQLPNINAIKCAALNCQYVIDEFARKLRKYEQSLGSETAGLGGRKEDSTNTSIHTGQGLKRKLCRATSVAKLKESGPLIKAGNKVSESIMKVRWELFMKEDVRDFRAYLTSHVGSLNMRMVTQGLSVASITAQEADNNHTILECKLTELRDGIKNEFKSQQLILQNTNTLLDKVIDLVNVEIAPQLKENWNCNAQVLEIVKNIQNRIPYPNTRFTWFQEPCHLEDARGHRLPIPSEFNIGLIQAIIKELFRTGPGRRSVLAGDYQLSNIKNSNHLILGSENNSLTPGMNIRMAIVMNKLHTDRGKVCPMPHCGSAFFTNAFGGGHTCSDCGVWFAEACKVEKGPQIRDISDSSDDERPRKQFRNSSRRCATSHFEEERERLELVAIKNIRIPDPSADRTVQKGEATARSRLERQPAFKKLSSKKGNKGKDLPVQGSEDGRKRVKTKDLVYYGRFDIPRVKSNDLRDSSQFTVAFNDWPDSPRTFQETFGDLCSSDLLFDLNIPLNDLINPGNFGLGLEALNYIVVIWNI